MCGSLSNKNLKENFNRDSLVTRFSVRSRCTSSVIVTVCRVVTSSEIVTLKTLVILRVMLDKLSLQLALIVKCYLSEREI